MILTSLVLVGTLAVLGWPEAFAGIIISQSEVDTYDPYTQFARAAYCPNLKDWACGGGWLIGRLTFNLYNMVTIHFSCLQCASWIQAQFC